ncbi:MAG TPA: hypothetical protein VFQ65_13010 [Kofleriaceae bacterium]|nr:hypothetical protein [Kofleriaceae bacterium]
MTVTFGHAEGDGRAPFVPSEEWIEAFEAQATEELYQRVKRYARVRARLVAHAGRPIDELYSNDLVQDAIGDTFDGVLAWDPERVTLERHLQCAIHSRTRHEYVHALRFRQERIDLGARKTLAEVETTLARARGEPEDASDRVLAELHQLAVRDPDVIEMLRLFGEQVIKKDDIVRATGWNTKRYQATRKRMLRLVQQLPNDVREAAMARA